ncbi:Neuropeptide Y receptor type 4 [Folsomia candida]|uniref:Neuropeptide Y receptor type 4 n=1 Tax=Folsomia candida TaxID=158441 RepID=A0A226EH45_FOLCA|nr:Neuropeptide Y receptor type 4 [Folsomia candida]
MDSWAIRYGEVGSNSSLLDLNSLEYSNEELYADLDMVELITSNASTAPSLPTNLHPSFEVDRTYFIITAIVATISSTFNGVSIYLISQKKRLRPVDYLVANLCFSTFFMCLTLLGSFSMTHMSVMMTFSQSKQWMCSLINFGKYFPGALVTLSSFGISFERVRSLKTRSGRTVSTGTAVKTIIFIWLAAVLITSPALLRSTHSTADDQNPSTIPTLCKRVCVPLHPIYKLVKNINYTLAYELIKSKIKYLGVYSVPGPRLQRKVCRVRFAFLYSIILVLVWVSSGAVQLVYRVPIWFTSISSSTSRASKSYSFLMGITFAYLFVNPLAVFFSNQDIKIFRKFLCRTCHADGITTPTRNAAGCGKDLDNNAATQDDTDLDISRFATQQATTFSISENQLPKKLEQRQTSNNNPEDINFMDRFRKVSFIRHQQHQNVKPREDNT